MVYLLGDLLFVDSVPCDIHFLEVILHDGRYIARHTEQCKSDTGNPVLNAFSMEMWN